MQSLSDKEIIKKFKTYCSKEHINTSNILAITIQLNRSTKCTSFIIDFDNEKLLKAYTLENDGKTVDKYAGSFSISYHANLPRLDESAPAQVDAPGSAPFCCHNLVPFKPTRTARDSVFADLLSGQGNHPDIVYEVKAQVDNGPMISTRYFKVLSSKIKEIDRDNNTNKIHSFKNYKCPTHNRFYGIDLYSTREGSNYHHMRASPFEKRDMEVLDSFFKEFDI
ncbi:hypothetical protein DFA_01142 [Cavenderia fasciculata]|uniref:Uncharacterized protein n=1 Tax=Cavenderia fasciculata TaxID=261658 RepID=F4PQZ8_CACFS|nr:uncharacterized protein DFA_01142 [Cavenderia fasciculata]EGG21263.1 hypothetical protein DFA_01142 [Cavenderia fasciculata]|eukprot:XP_004359113.1 hypothetical protein DFA_01142 [Cavenderia fasciculata]